MSLKIEAGGKAVIASVFVQPDSKRRCLLDVNIAPSLGHQPKPSQKQISAMVCLTQTSTLRGIKEIFGSLIIKSGTEIIFEPNTESFRPLGLSALGSLLRIQRDGAILIPLQNFKQDRVDNEAGFDLGGVEPLQAKFLMQPSCSQVTTRRQAKLQDDLKSKLKAILNLAGKNLTPEQFQQLENKLMNNADIFAIDERELGHTTVVNHSIDTRDHPPTKQCPRHTPFVHREKIAQLVNDMLKQQVIQPSSSAWASPVVLVPKKDGNLHFCVEYRKINAVTKKDVYPLPRAHDILKYFGQS